MFDAITGNNDRHFFNWGVLTNIKGNFQPKFSPIYDSARGLFWNDSEQKIENLFSKGTIIDENLFNGYLKKYMNRSLPKIGWDGMSKLNHFQLIENIYTTYPNYQNICKDLLNEVLLQNVLDMLNKEFSNFFSKKRLILIEHCLIRRFKTLQEICK